MNQRRIVIDGKTYASVEEMPEEVRRNYEEAMKGFTELNPGNFTGAMSELKNIFADKNNNGTPEIFEGSQVVNIAGNVKFVVDGKTVNSLDELPPEARARYERATAVLDRNQNGTPDLLEGLLNPQMQSQPIQPAIDQPNPPTRSVLQSAPPISPAIAPDTSNGWLLALAIVGVLFLCMVGAAGFWYFFLR